MTMKAWIKSMHSLSPYYAGKAMMSDEWRRFAELCMLTDKLRHLYLA